MEFWYLPKVVRLDLGKLGGLSGLEVLEVVPDRAAPIFFSRLAFPVVDLRLFEWSVEFESYLLDWLRTAKFYGNLHIIVKDFIARVFDSKKLKLAFFGKCDFRSFPQRVDLESAKTWLESLDLKLDSKDLKQLVKLLDFTPLSVRLETAISGWLDGKAVAMSEIFVSQTDYKEPGWNVFVAKVKDKKVIEYSGYRKSLLINVVLKDGVKVECTDFWVRIDYDLFENLKFDSKVFLFVKAD